MQPSHRNPAVLAALALLALCAAHQALACQVVLMPVERDIRIRDDRVRPHWRPPTPSDLPFRVTESKVEVKIEENVASTAITQTFENLSNQVMEVRVLIPLPSGAAINKSALSMGDQMVDGKLLNANEAQGIYESIVSQRRDPALLRFAGENLYEARIFPVQPNEQRSLRFAYDQLLAPVNGLYDYRHILAGSQLYRSGAEKYSFECRIKSKSDLGPVYSPSHSISVDRPDPRTAVVKFGQANLSTDKDFHLYFAPSTEDVALRVVTHRPPGGEDGYFMLLGRPDDQLEGNKVLPKELVLVLDTSGSMAGEKMEQARKALTFCLSQLNPKDRFNLVTFSTEVNSFSPGKLVEATKENVKKVLNAVDTLEATGGTDIHGALRAALDNDFTPGPEKAKLIIFLTDGLPSIGVTDSATILKDAGASNKAGARVFTFGVGTDVNAHLLDKLALNADGVSSYVAPKEDLELKVSDFYSKIKHPVMTDVKIEFAEAVKVNSVYPKKLPALFKGSEILLFGRYKGTGPGAVTLTGNVSGERKELRLPVEWAREERGNDFLPRIWAMRKIGHLLEEIRLRGSNQETIDEIVTLSQRHGIVTPYTSQLVLEPGMNWNAPGWDRRRDAPVEELRLGFARPAGPAADPAKAPELALNALEDGRRKAREEAKQSGQQGGQIQSGAVAVALADLERQMKDAKAEPATPPAVAATSGLNVGGALDRDALARQELHEKALLLADGFAGGDKEGEAKARGRLLSVAQQVGLKQIGDRTFYLRSGYWVDSTLQLKKDEKPTVVKAFSKEYFELLKKHPKLGAVLALGGQILVNVEGKAYQIEPEEQKK